MKKLAFLLILLQGCLFAYPKVSQDLTEAVNLIYHFPESRKILEKAERNGPISIYSAPCASNFGAMWVPDERAIVMNSLHKKSLGEKTRTILFELHNAFTSKDFDSLDAQACWKKISKRDYIIAVEYMEYQNALNTKLLVDKAIIQNYFPKDSYWNVPTDFNQHLDMQLYCGHADAIGSIYDNLHG